MRLTLTDIDRAVRANFMLSATASKYLEADDTKEYHFKTAARIVFVGVAVENGFKYDRICDHLSMTVTEFNAFQRQFKEHLQEGRIKNGRRKKDNRYDQGEALDFDLRIYRKYVLVRNCIEYLKRKRLVFI